MKSWAGPGNKANIFMLFSIGICNAPPYNNRRIYIHIYSVVLWPHDCFLLGIFDSCPKLLLFAEVIFLAIFRPYRVDEL